MTTTPYSLVSATCFTVSVAIPPLASCAARSAPRSTSVSASAAITRNGSSPKNSRTFRTPPAVPSSSSSKLHSSDTPYAEPSPNGSRS